MISIRLYQLFVLLVCFTSSAWAVTGKLLSIRGNESQAQEFAARNGFDLVNSTTTEFGNGNTFVRFQDNVHQANVFLLLPETLTPDQLMEVLIKIRTAKSGGAKTISIVSPRPLAQIKVDHLVSNVDRNFLEDMLRTAGADAVREGQEAKPRLLKPKRRRPKTQPSRPAESVVVGQKSVPLSELLSRELGLKHVPHDDLNKVKRKHVYYVAASDKPTNENLFNMLVELRGLRQNRDRVDLITPYLPYARSDKIDQAGVSITGRLVADLIEAAEPQSITFVRAHAPQSQGFFSIPSYQTTSRPTILSYLSSKDIDIFIAPDAGAQKETTLFADEGGKKPVGVANKQRDPVTGVATLRGISGPDVKGKRVVVVDDETESGKTLASVIKALHEAGASEIYVVVTHMAGNAAKVLESPFVKEMIATDTIPQQIDDPRFVRLSIASELGDLLKSNEALRRAKPPPCNRILEFLGRLTF